MEDLWAVYIYIYKSILVFAYEYVPNCADIDGSSKTPICVCSLQTEHIINSLVKIGSDSAFFCCYYMGFFFFIIIIGFFFAICT